MTTPGTITQLRFLDKDRLTYEHENYKNYYREIINFYGIDAEYFLHNAADYFYGTSPSGNTYGQYPSIDYDTSANVRTYIEFDNDSIMMSKFGIETDTDGKAYFVIDDFVEQFRDEILGRSLTKAGSVDVTVDASTETSVEIPFSDDYISGTFSMTITELEAASYEFSASFVPDTAYKHDYIYLSDSYDTRYNVGTATGTLSRDGDTITGTVQYNLTYYVNKFNFTMYEIYAGEEGAAFIADGPTEDDAPQYFVLDNNTTILHENGKFWTVAPRVGDFFRIEFDDDNLEEYEITQVTDRRITTDGINALLKRYIYECNITRRTPSHETVSASSTKEEAWTVDKTDANDFHESISDEIFDYETETIDEESQHGVDIALNLDSVYGNYDVGSS